MAATPDNSNKRARGEDVKAEDKVDKLELEVPPPALSSHSTSLVLAPPPVVWDRQKAHARGQEVSSTIAEFVDAFVVDGETVPFILHFLISDWIKGFSKELIRLGVQEPAANRQIGVTLLLGLARWAKRIIKSKAGKELSLGAKWLCEPYVNTAMAMGYIVDKAVAIDTILKTIPNIP